MRKLPLLLFFLILLLPVSGSGLPLPGAGEDEYEELSSAMKKTREHDIETARTKDKFPRRKGSEDKAPWQGDSLWDAESTLWPHFSPWEGAPTYPNPYGRDTLPWSWLGRSFQGCTISCDDTGWETSALTGTNDCQEGKKITCDIWPIITDAIVEKVSVTGPVRWNTKPGIGGSAVRLELQIYQNATPGTKIDIVATTTSLSLPPGTSDDRGEDTEVAGLRLLDESANLDIIRANLNTASTADQTVTAREVISICDETLRADCEDECECIEGQPTIDASVDNQIGETVPQGGSFTVWVDSGGLACPTYEWTIDNSTGSGFSFVSGATVESGYSTSNDLETMTIYVNNWACGYATVSVTDECGETDSYEVLCASGHWVTIDDGNAIFDEVPNCAGCNEAGNPTRYIYDGNQRWYFWENLVNERCIDHVGCLTWSGALDPANWPPCGLPEQCGDFTCSCGGVPFYYFVRYYEWECL